MSSIGTGIATSVAQVSQNASQTSRARDKSRADVQRAAREEADRFEHRLHAPGQADDPDAELPDRQAPGYEQLYLKDGNGQPLAEPSTTLDPPADAHPFATLFQVPTPTFPLYQHLDVQA